MLLRSLPISNYVPDALIFAEGECSDEMMKCVKESLQDFGLLDTEQVTAIRMVPKGILQVNIRRLSSCSLRNSLMCPLCEQAYVQTTLDIH